MRSGVIQTSKQTCIAKGMRCSMWQKIRDKMNRVKDKIVNIVIVLISVIATVVIIIKCLHEGIPNAFDASDRLNLSDVSSCHLVSDVRRKDMKAFFKNFWEDQSGMGVVEVILIIVVLIGLVIIFKTQITEVVNDIFEKIVSQSSSV